MSIMTRIPSGCRQLDELLRGGIEKGIITQFYGEAGCGKSNLAITYAVSCLNNGDKVAYIDTDGLSIERVVQVARMRDFSDIARNLYVWEVLDFDQQYSAVNNLGKVLEADDRFSLVVLDSATGLYRMELSKDHGISPKQELANQLSHLLGFARKYSISVLITNQTYRDVETKLLRPLGGSVTAHLSKAIIRLEKLAGPKRRAVLEKHRSQPSGSSCTFTIYEEGII